MLVNLRQAYTLTNHRRSVQRREEVGKEIILAREWDGEAKESGKGKGKMTGPGKGILCQRMKPAYVIDSEGESWVG